MKGNTEKKTVLQDCTQKVAEHLYSEWEMQNFIKVPKEQISGFFFFLLQTEKCINSYYTK